MLTHSQNKVLSIILANRIVSRGKLIDLGVDMQDVNALVDQKLVSKHFDISDQPEYQIACTPGCAAPAGGWCSCGAI